MGIFKSAFDGIGNFFRNPVKTFKTAFDGLSNVAQHVSRPIDSFFNTASKISNAVKDVPFLGEIYKTSGIGDVMNTARDVYEGVKDIASTIGNTGQSLLSGQKVDSPAVEKKLSTDYSSVKDKLKGLVGSKKNLLIG